MQNNWLDSLSEETRLKALKMIEQMKELGAKDAESWVRSEVTEDIPQIARFLILQQLWKEIESFEKDVFSWTQHYIEDAEKRSESYFAESGFALKRTIDSGVSLEDIGKVAKAIAFESSFQTVHIIDEGYVSEELPFWELMEIDSEGKPTGRSIQGLHEDLLNE